MDSRSLLVYSLQNWLETGLSDSKFSLGGERRLSLGQIELSVKKIHIFHGVSTPMRTRIIIAAYFFMACAAATATAAAAENDGKFSPCGETRLYELVEAGGNNWLGKILRDPTENAIACRDGNRWYVVSRNEKFALFVDNTAIPEEVFLQRPISSVSRVRFLETIFSRAQKTVDAALSSGLIRDPLVAEILTTMRSQILRDFDAFSEKIGFCGSLKDIAYVEGRGESARIYFCPLAFETDSPHSLIHESVHLILARQGLSYRGISEECQADYVAAVATRIGAQLGVIRQSWDAEGFYMNARNCPSVQEKFFDFLNDLYSYKSESSEKPAMVNESKGIWKVNVH